MRSLVAFVLTTCVLLGAPHAGAQAVDVSSYGARPGSGQDSTAAVEKAIAFALENHRALVKFPRGRYDFWPAAAAKRRLFISNHDDLAERAVAMPIEHAHGLTLDGGGSEFVFHDSILPVAVADSDGITLRDFSIDYATPHIVQARVVGSSGDTATLHIDDTGTYEVKNGAISIRAEGFEQPAHSSVVFDPVEKGLVPGTGDNWQLFKTTAEALGPGMVRVSGLKQHTRPGDVLVLWNGDRPNPAIFVGGSTGVTVSHVNVYGAQGMGFIAQKGEGVHLDGFNVELKPGSGRYVTTMADATHFSNCRGQLTIENGLFENMLDDGINVHGSYLRVAGRPAPDTVTLEWGHPQTFGLEFAAAGDQLRFVHPQTIEPYATATVADVQRIDDKHLRVRFTGALPASVALRDGVENLAWRPTVLYRHNHIRHNRARGALFGSQASTVVEDNFFDHLSGPAILFSADASYWFENAPAHNVLVRHNRFVDTNTGTFGPAPIWIDPPFQPAESASYFSVRNIRIEDNQFDLLEQPIVYARSVEGLSFLNNTVTYNHADPATGPAFSLNHARCVDVSQNTVPGMPQVKMQDTSLVSVEGHAGTYDPKACAASFKPLPGEQP